MDSNIVNNDDAMFMAAVGERQVFLRWSPVDYGSVLLYRLLRSINEGAYEHIITTNLHNYVDAGLEAGCCCQYKLVAVDASGRPLRIVASQPVKVLPDHSVPSITGLEPDDCQYCGRVTLKAQVTDNVAVARVDFYYSVDDGTGWRTIPSAGCVASLDTHQIENGECNIRVVASDTSGNQSEFLRTARISNIPPLPPVIKAYNNGFMIVITWEDYSEPEGLYCYHIYASRFPMTEYTCVDRTTQKRFAYHKAEDKLLYIAVTAADKYGNESAKSNSVQV